jgi:HK97 gp10 family phage protein
MSEYSSGLDDIFAKMDAHHRVQETRRDQAVQNAGLVCEGSTKRRCPVGTPESTGIKGYKGGRLRSSYKYKRTGWMECKVGTNTEYGPYVELGTRYMKARPHLFPGYLDGKKALEEELKSIGP